MRAGVWRHAGWISVVTLVLIAVPLSGKPPLLPTRLRENTRDSSHDALSVLWSLLDGAADKAYNEQAYRDAAGSSVLSYLIASGLEDSEKSFTSAQRIAFCYHFLGDTEPALSAYRLVLNSSIPGVVVKLTAEQDDPGLAKLDTDQRVVRTLMNLGVLCVNARKLDTAQIYFLRAIHLTELEAPSTEIGKFRVEHLGARAKTGLADVYQDKGNYDQAVKVYAESRTVFQTEYNYLQLRERLPVNVADRASMLAAAKQNLAHCQRNLGEAYLDSPAGSLSEAKAQLEESLRLRKEIGNNILIADSEIALSELGIAEHRYDDALQLAASAALRTAPDSAGDNPDTYWQALLCQGKSLLEVGRPGEAAVPLKTAIRVVESLKDPNVGVQENNAFFNSITWFFRQKVAPYIAMAEVCVAQDRPTEALRYVELAKARTLLLGRPLNAVNREDSLGAISIGPDDLSRVLAVTVPDQQTAALEYMFGTNRGYVFLVTRSETDDRPTVKVSAFETEKPLAGLVHAGSPRSLDSAIKAFRSKLEKSYTAYPTALGFSLYEVLVKPFERELMTKEHIVVVPTGDLWKIPFEALSTSRTEPSYLVTNYAISYTPSLIFLARIIERANRVDGHASAHSFILANPRVTERLSTASDSGSNSLASVFSSQSGFFQNKSFTASDATRRCFLGQAPAAQLIVIATHAVAAGNNPVDSFFAVTPEPGINSERELTAADIMSARLSAKLAVLCACETEKGRYVEGEGEIGCGWAFLYAGCASTLVSQWRVDRDATFQLTKEFCHALDRGLMAASGQVSLAGLLRSTQLAMLADGHYGHPFYWAGIVLVGDPLWRSRPNTLEQ